MIRPAAALASRSVAIESEGLERRRGGATCQSCKRETELVARLGIRNAARGRVDYLVVAMRRSRGLQALPSRGDGRLYLLRGRGELISRPLCGVRSAPWWCPGPNDARCRLRVPVVGRSPCQASRHKSESARTCGRFSSSSGAREKTPLTYDTQTTTGMPRAVAPAGLTLGRADDIEKGVGEPATEEELAQLAAFKALTAPFWAKIRPQVVEVLSDLEATGYERLPLRERLRYRRWTPKAYLLHRRQLPRTFSPLRSARRHPRSRATTSRRARAPAREPDRPRLARPGGRVSLPGGRSC